MWHLGGVMDRVVICVKCCQHPSKNKQMKMFSIVFSHVPCMRFLTAQTDEEFLVQLHAKVHG